jgi:hypothetical protein
MTKEAQMIPRLSPVSWDHINLKGKYEFRSNTKSPNLQALAENLIKNYKIDFGL